MNLYCDFCKEPFLAGDLLVPAEQNFHGDLHAECQPLWEEQYYYGDTQASWERWWQPYLASINGELTTAGGCVIIPAQPTGMRREGSV